MHPRDMDTWMEMEELAASEVRLAQERQAVRELMGGG